MNLTRAEARERAALIDVDSYEVSLDLTRGEKVFGSTTAVKFRAKPGSSTFIDAVTHAVHSVSLNGRELDPAEVSDGVRIQLPDLAAENDLLVVADAPYMNTGEGLHRFVDPVDNEVYLYTQFEVPDSRRMFAVFEQPDLKASFTFTVTAPSHWDVVSNSPTPVPVETIPGADGGARSVWEFTPTPRLSSYVTALIAGPYQSVRSEVTSAAGKVTPLGIFARKSLMQYLDADNIFELTRQGFEFFEAQFGCPYPFEKYDQLFVPEFNAGAMENAGAVTILEGYVFRGKVTDAQVERRAITVLHELAHMWFGDLVTMRWWNDLWLNESFAEYMSHLAAVENTEFDHAWTTFASVEKSWAYRQDQLPTTHPIFAEINDLQDVEVNFDGITYAKGASVLRQLVAWVGPEQFMAGVREYFSKHAWQNTELSDLMAELEKASGRDLERWGQLWLETAGVNTLTPEISAWPRTAPSTSFAIVQSAIESEPTLRPHRLAVGFYNLNGAGKLERVHREELDVDGERTEVSGPGRPGPAGPDPAQRRRPRLRQGPPGPEVPGHRHGAPEGLQPEPPPHARVGLGLGCGARRRIPGPRVRGADPRQHRRGIRFLRDPGPAPPAGHHAELLRGRGAPGGHRRGRGRQALGARLGGAGRLGRPAAVREVLRPAGPQRRAAGHGLRAAGRLTDPGRAEPWTRTCGGSCWLPSWPAAAPGRSRSTPNWSTTTPPTARTRRPWPRPPSPPRRPRPRPGNRLWSRAICPTPCRAPR